MGASTPDPVRRKFEGEIEAGRILVVVDGDGEAGERADRAIVATGATPLPFEQPTALS
jgi:glycine/D-amino acid oxidase-like deaminating enzyme